MNNCVEFNHKNQMDRLYAYANDSDFHEWYIEYVKALIEESSDGTLTSRYCGGLLVKSILMNDALGVLDAIAGAASDIEFVIDMYEDQLSEKEEE